MLSKTHPGTSTSGCNHEGIRRTEQNSSSWKYATILESLGINSNSTKILACVGNFFIYLHFTILKNANVFLPLRRLLTKKKDMVLPWRNARDNCEALAVQLAVKLAVQLAAHPSLASTQAPRFGCGPSSIRKANLLGNPHGMLDHMMKITSSRLSEPPRRRCGL